MDKRSLESFVAVYRSRCLAEAAERLNISQSALSRRITELQSKLGVALFEPSGRGLAATSDAQQLLPLALSALEGITALEAAARTNGPQQSIHLTVAATTHMIESVVVHCIPDFVRANPNIRIGLVEAGGVEIEDLILSGKAQLGLTGRPRFDTGLVERLIARLDIVAAAREPFTATERRKGIDLRVLCGRDLLLLDRRHQTRLTFDAAVRLLQLSPKVFHEGSSANLLLALARAGLGTALISSSTRTDLHTAKIVANGVTLGMDFSAIWDPTLRWRSEVEQFAMSLQASLTRHDRGRARKKAA